MPITTVTIDDTSALIQYHGVGGVPWTDSPTSDRELGNYWDSTYHSTQIWRASATFLFDGVAVSLFAAKRSRHGAYGVYLDGQYAFNNNGYSLDPQFKQVMYSVDGLVPGKHNLTLINIDPSNQTYTEIDYITWVTSMNPNLTESLGPVISHTSQDMTWSSLAAWSLEQDSDPTMVTSTDGASVTIRFSGNGIMLSGKTGIAYGMFSVQVDGNMPRQLNASSQQTHSTLLYREDNLKSGNHTLTVINNGGGYTSLSIGSATPIIWSEGPNSSSNSHSNQGATSNLGAIVGAAVGTVVGFAAVLLFALWFLRRKRSRQRVADELNQRPQTTFLDPTPFILPQSPQLPQSPNRPSYESRSKSDVYVQYPQVALGAGPSSPGLSSPGLSSRGSFDFGRRSATMMTGFDSFSAGPSSSGRGPGSDFDRGTIIGNPARYPGSTVYDVESMRDRDAGPVVLPQLPPAYSDASPTRPTTASPSTSYPPQSPTPEQPSSSASDSKAHPPTR